MLAAPQDAFYLIANRAEEKHADALKHHLNRRDLRICCPGTGSFWTDRYQGRRGSTMIVDHWAELDVKDYTQLTLMGITVLFYGDK